MTLKLCIATLASLVLVQSALGATFFNETSEPISPEELQSLRTTATVIRTEDDEEEILIDDMRFRVSSLLRTGFSGTRWPKGQLIYQFESNLPEHKRSRFLAACGVWSEVSAVTCVRRTAQRNYVNVISSSNNRSFVGMIGGKQDLEVYNWTWKFIIAHEIGHALGLSHEQCRRDRDKFVEVLWDNISEGKEMNFKIRRTTNYTPYDFRSIMHYGPSAFTKNGGPTIQAKPAYKSQEPHMGNRSYLSAGDASGMASRYGARPVSEQP